MRDLDFLAEVTQETLSSLHVGQLSWRVIRLLRQRFGYGSAAMGLVEGDETVVFRAGRGESNQLDLRDPSRVRFGQGTVGEVAETGKPRLIHDAAKRASGSGVSQPCLCAPLNSELCVPLVHHDSVIGTLVVQSSAERAFDEGDLQLLELIGAIVAPALHAARVHERERRRVRHLRLVHQISRLVMSSLERDHVVSMSCRAMLETLDISFVAIVLLDRSRTRVLQAGHASRLEFVEGIDFASWSAQLGEGISSEVIRSGQTVRIGDVTKHPSYREVVRGIRSHLSVPLRVLGATVGALVVEHDEADHFDEDDVELLENLAGYLAQAIDNARLFDSQRKRWQQLLLINEVARLATKSMELEQILNMVAREAHDRFGYPAVAVLLREDGAVVARALAPESGLQLELGHRVSLESGLSGVAARDGRTVRVARRDDFGDEPLLLPDAQSALCVPLSAGDRIIGAISAQSEHVNAFDDDDRLVLETLAKSVAGAIANARSIRQTEQLREDLNRMIVHDLRNPVQAVQLTLQEVLRKGQLAQPLQDAVRESFNCTEDILGMINSLLDVARFEAGRQRLRMAPAVLNDHIRAVVRRFSPLARSKQIQVTTVLSQQIPVMRFDHELINRMLSNLVGNALKFTPEGAQVNVRSELVDEARDDVRLGSPCVLVSIKDTGEGIPAAYHEKIFEKYGQVESRKAGLRMSTGLGLALCRYVVQAHRGAIWVDSAPHQGSTFFIALPVEKRD